MGRSEVGYRTTSKRRTCDDVRRYRQQLRRCRVEPESAKRWGESKLMRWAVTAYPLMIELYLYQHEGQKGE